MGKTITEKLVSEQISLQHEIQEAGLNIITCGHCGTVLLHRILPIEEDQGIQCFGCLREMDYSDCPDLWWEGTEVPEPKKPFTEWMNMIKSM